MKEHKEFNSNGKVMWNILLQKGTISRSVDPLVMPGGRRNIGRASSNKLLPPSPPPNQLLNDDAHKQKYVLSYNLCVSQSVPFVCKSAE